MTPSLGRSRLIVVCGDTPQQRRQLIEALLRRLDRQHRKLQPGAPLNRAVRVVDLSGEPLLLSADVEVTRFRPRDVAAAVWRELQEPLAPWLALLQLEGLDPRPPWAFPGLDAVLRCLFWADALASQPDSTTVLVVLPPLPQALPILRLARRGPELLESLWLPLLGWWGETRQRLSHLELVLRLHLPEAGGLQLSERWRGDLDRLAAALDPANGCELVLAIAAEAGLDLALIQNRIAALPLSDLPLSRVWIQDRETADGAEGPLARFGLPLLSAADLVHDPEGAAWLDQPVVQRPVEWRQLAAGGCCRLFLPGLQPSDLEVHQVNDTIVLETAEHRLVLAMPKDWVQWDCHAARVVSPWLEIDFL